MTIRPQNLSQGQNPENQTPKPQPQINNPKRQKRICLGQSSDSQLASMVIFTYNRLLDCVGFSCVCHGLVGGCFVCADDIY